MGKSRIANLSAILVVGAMSVPLLASCSSTSSGTSSGTAKQLAELKGSDTVASDEFGVSVGISGTNAVVGTSGAAYPGRAYVFNKTAAGWKQVAELKGSDTVAADRFGTAVAISGTTVVVGAYDHAKDAGRAYVFAKTAAGWKQVAELRGSDVVAENGFGTSVAISGSTAIVGEEGYAKGTGRAYVFTKTTSGWTRVALLKAPDTIAGDNFGTSVAVSPPIAVVGAYGRANYAGRAYLFTDTDGGFRQTAELKGSDTTVGDYFGISAGISGSSVVIGAYDHAKDAGRAYVFAKTPSGWKETAELKGSDTVAEDYFGNSVAISGTTALTGAYGQAKYAGRAYLFKS